MKKTMGEKICFWLTAAYLINAVLSLAFGNQMLKIFLNDTFLGFGLACTIVMSIGCYIGSFFTDKTKTLKCLFAVSSLTLVPLVSEIYIISHDPAEVSALMDTTAQVYRLRMCMLFIALMICEWFLIAIWKRLNPLRKKRNMISAFVVCMVLCGAVMKVAYDQWLFWVVVTEFLLSFLGINLCGMLMQQEEKGEAEIVMQLVRIVNPVGMIFNMKGKTVGTLIYR